VKSVSPINGIEYKVPNRLDDVSNIENFRVKNGEKSVVTIQGLGFVGAAMAMVVANAFKEYAVIGVDVADEKNYWKIASLNEGVFPIIADDPKIEEYYTSSRVKGNFLATYDSYAYKIADVIIVDINLDVQKKSDNQNKLLDFDVDLSAFKKAIQIIGQNCREDALVLVETTVPVGTCKHIVEPILKEELTKRGMNSNRLKIGHSYERVMPGPKYIESIQNFYRVFSGINEESADATEEFLRSVIRTDEYPLTKLGNTNSTELAKVLENSFRAMNIAFISEWTSLAEEAEVNLFDVVNAIRMRPTHKNIMLPGLGVGGYCLTKDPLLASWSKVNVIKSKNGLEQSEASVRINDQLPLHAFKSLKKFMKDDLNGKNILLLGVSYLNDVGDSRYTPVETLYNLLKSAGARISLHDPFISYWEEEEIAINNDLKVTFESNYDVIVISTGHKIYRDNELLFDSIIKGNALLYDTIGVFTNEFIERIRSNNKSIKVIGRGDL